MPAHPFSDRGKVRTVTAVDGGQRPPKIDNGEISGQRTDDNGRFRDDAPMPTELKVNVRPLALPSAPRPAAHCDLAATLTAAKVASYRAARSMNVIGGH